MAARGVKIAVTRPTNKYGKQARGFGTPRSGVYASLTTALAGANDDLTFVSKLGGTSGNSVRIQYVVAGANTPLSVAVSGSDITVNVATSAGSAATSTAAQIRDAVNAHAGASALVAAMLAVGNDGSGVVSALAFASLSGGVNAITPAGGGPRKGSAPPGLSIAIRRRR